MKANKQEFARGYNYFIHLNGVHYERYNTVEAALGDLVHLAKLDTTESVTIETRDFWLHQEG